MQEQLNDIKDRCERIEGTQIRIENKLDDAIARSIKNETRVDGMRTHIAALWTLFTGGVITMIKQIFGG